LVDIERRGFAIQSAFSFQTRFGFPHHNNKKWQQRMPVSQM
jgi:hypothetical protein